MSNPFDDPIKHTLLTSALQSAVTIAIDDIQHGNGGYISNYDIERSQLLADEIASKSDNLLFYTKGKTAEAFTAVVRALAILAFAPGGVKLFGLHFEAKREES